MLFKKKKRMIDVRELQRKGVVRIPKEEIVVPTNRDGFVEMTGSGMSNIGSGMSKQTTTSTTTENKSPTTSNTDFFGFLDSPSSEGSSGSSFSTESDGYNKREVDAKITNLDNKIYKLEQRVELLEKKLDVNQPEQKLGPMGW